MQPLADAGYHVVAPDLRGYGRSDCPKESDQYTILHLVGDVVDLIGALGAKEAIVPVAAISSGSISVDYALGVGGFPRGRICEIFGPESSGKTTIALQVIAEAQKQGGMAAFIDVEHALDPIYARKLGVDIDEKAAAKWPYKNAGDSRGNDRRLDGTIVRP